MSWSPDLFIGELRPWPDSVRVVRGETDETQLYGPEQTCHLVKEHIGNSGKAYRMVCSECHHVIYDGWQEKPRYCAFCGARVEDE